MSTKIPVLSVYDEAGNRIPIPAIRGKSAYAYAQDGGYTGTEEDFAKKLAQDVPEGGGSGGGAGMWEHICDITTTEETTSIEITQNKDGVPLSELKYNEIWASAKMIGVSTNAGNWWHLFGITDQNRQRKSSQGGGTTGTKYVTWYVFIRGNKSYATDGSNIDPFDMDGGDENWLGNYLDYHNSDHFVSIKVEGTNQGIIGIGTEIRITGRRA